MKFVNVFWLIFYCLTLQPLTAQVSPKNESIVLGFNAKGILDVDQQTHLLNLALKSIETETKTNLVIRVTGGTISQITYNKDWTDESITTWTNLQKKHGFRMVFVVNGNDAPKNQKILIQRWLNAGAKFDFLEMMNEYYLPKFSKGDLSKEEVKQKVTAQIYATEILPQFWLELDEFQLPYYIIFAPRRKGKKEADQKMKEWNEWMFREVIQKYPNRNLNASLHLYSNGEDLKNFDFDQIDELRSRLPKDRHIAITESGILNRGLSSKEVGEYSVRFYKSMMKHLIPGDYLMDQVLYNPAKRNNTSVLDSETEVLSPKGKIIFDFIQNSWKEVQ